MADIAISSAVDAPRVVVALGVCHLTAVVPVEVTERTAALLDDSHTECAVIFDVPAEFVAVVDVQFLADVGGNVRLIPRNLALGIDTLATHI